MEGRLKAIEEDKKKPYNAAGFMTLGVCGGTWDPDDKDDRLVDDDEEEEQEVMDVVEEVAEERVPSIAAPPIFVVGSRVDALYDDDFSYYPAVVPRATRTAPSPSITPMVTRRACPRPPCACAPSRTLEASRRR